MLVCFMIEHFAQLLIFLSIFVASFKLFVLSLAHLFTHFVLSLQLALLVLHFHIFTWNVGIVGCKYFSVCVCVRVFAHVWACALCVI